MCKSGIIVIEITKCSLIECDTWFSKGIFHPGAVSLVKKIHASGSHWYIKDN